jgi:hypothetical protein
MQCLQAKVPEAHKRILGDEHLDTLTSVYSLAGHIGIHPTEMKQPNYMSGNCRCAADFMELKIKRRRRAREIC